MLPSETVPYVFVPTPGCPPALDADETLEAAGRGRADDVEAESALTPAGRTSVVDCGVDAEDQRHCVLAVADRMLPESVENLMSRALERIIREAESSEH